MAVALALEPPEIAVPSAAFIDFVAAIGNIEAPLRETVASAELALTRGEEQLNRVITDLRSLVEIARTYVASGGQFGSRLDDLIAEAEQVQERIARDDAGVRKIISRIRSLLRRSKPELAAAVEAPIKRYEEIADRYQAELQQIRWQLMAIRAEEHRDETGPAFSDPGDLKRYLGSLPH